MDLRVLKTPVNPSNRPLVSAHRVTVSFRLRLIGVVPHADIILGADAKTPSKRQVKSAAASVKQDANQAMGEVQGKARDAKDDVKKQM